MLSKEDALYGAAWKVADYGFAADYSQSWQSGSGTNEYLQFDYPCAHASARLTRSTEQPRMTRRSRN